MGAAQFAIQFALSLAALTIPGLLAFNLGPRYKRRLALPVQLAILVGIAVAFAALPWTNPYVGCPDC